MNFGKYLLVLTIVTCLSACSEDFQLTESWKDIPVIYGMVDLTDTAQYIRVEKAFLDENLPASQIAQIPDSLYYKNAIVKIFNFRTKTETELIKVDASKEGYQRKSGPFAAVPNYLFKVPTKQLNWLPGDSIEIRLKKEEDPNLVTSKTRIVGSARLNNEDQKFLIIRPDFQGKLSLVYRLPTEGRIMSSKMHVTILEFSKNNPNDVDTVFGSFNIVSNQPLDGSPFLVVEKDGLDFYNFLADLLDESKSVDRFFRSMDIEISCAGQELYDYLTLVNANTGITASQEIPRYSNISSGGYGIFSSKSTYLKKGLLPESTTLDSLRSNVLTRSLGF